jgi:hypothetical protein
MSYPINLWVGKQPNSEVPFNVVFFGGLLLFVWSLRKRRNVPTALFGVGVLMGIASLIRPIAIAVTLALVFVAFVWTKRQALRLRAMVCGLLILGNLLAVAPWELWAWSETDRLIPLSSAGRTALIAGIVPPSDTAFGRDVPTDVKALMNRARSQKDELRSPAGVVAFLWRQLQEHPGSLMRLLVLKAVGPWYVTFNGRLDRFVGIVQLAYAALIAGGVIAVLRSRAAGQREALVLVLSLTAYFWAFAFITAPRVRFMVPALGLLLILAARAIEALIVRSRPTGST